MKEVAKLAGVSTSTVSKVINGKDKDISEKTRKKVLEIVESSNYVPYLKYLEKDNLKNAMIGLIIRRNHRERETVVMAAEAAANRYGYQLLIRYVEDKAEISECMESMARKKRRGSFWIPKNIFRRKNWKTVSSISTRMKNLTSVSLSPSTIGCRKREIWPWNTWPGSDTGGLPASCTGKTKA